MAQRTVYTCDICKTDRIEEEIGPIKVTFKFKDGSEVVRFLGNPDAGNHICRYCQIDAVKALDDRPKEHPTNG